MSFDDVIAVLGLACFLAGVYLWLGLPATLMILGVALIYTGARMEVHEPNKATDTDGA